MYVDIGGVFSNLVTFHLSPSPVVSSENLDESQVTTSVLSLREGVYSSSEIAGMLLKLTVSARDTKVIPKVAFKSGSSQHGNALRAAVG